MSSLKQRLDSFIASQTQYSRRKVQELIQNRQIKVNAKVVHDLSKLVNPKVDKIMINSQLIAVDLNYYYYKFNKPKNVLSTLQDPKGRLCLGDFYNKVSKSVIPVGRLDRKTTGLMIFTNDGELANHILHPRYKLKKVYRLILDVPITKRHVKRLTTGIFLDDGPVVLDHVEIESLKQLTITLSVGRNKIVRRLFAFLGYDVVMLKRIAIGSIQLNKCPEGEFQELTKIELKSIMSILKAD